MSTVLYAYRLDKADLWPLVDQVRAFYCEHHPLYQELLGLAAQALSGPRENG